MPSLNSLIHLAFICSALSVFCQSLGDECANALPFVLKDPSLTPCDFQELSSFDFDDLQSNPFVSANGLNPACNFNAGSHRDLWFRTTIPTNADGFKISIDNATANENAYNNFSVAVYTGTSCAALNYFTCKTSNSNLIYYNYFDGMAPNTTVYVRVFRRNTTSGAWQHPFFVRFASTHTSTSNDRCENAVPLENGSFCNHTATDKDEDDDNTPDRLTGTPNACDPTFRFGSYENNQWFSFQVTASTTQPFNISLLGVDCNGSEPLLQVAVWKTNSFQCGNWASGVDLLNASNAGDGALVACAIGSGTVNLSKNLPLGNYWFTIDGSRGAFCKYDIQTNNPPLSNHEFRLKRLPNGSLSVENLKPSNFLFAVLEASSNGVDFYSIDSIQRLQTGYSLNRIWEYSFLESLGFSYFRMAVYGNENKIKHSNLVYFSKLQSPKNIFLEGNTLRLSEIPNEDVNLTIYDLTGRMYFQTLKRIGDEQEIRFDLSELQAGFYVLNVVTDQQQFFMKWLKR